MKNINKVIRHKLIEITMFLLIIVVSFPLWEVIMKNDSFSMASTLANTSMVYADVVNYQNYEFYPMSDDVALKYLNPMKINLKNDTTYNPFYTLVLRVDKKSTLSYEKLKLSMNNNVFYVKDLYLKEDNQYYYFLLEKDVLKVPEKEYLFSLWLDENADVSSKETFIYSVVNLENLFTI